MMCPQKALEWNQATVFLGHEVCCQIICTSITFRCFPESVYYTVCFKPGFANERHSQEVWKVQMKLAEFTNLKRSQSFPQFPRSSPLCKHSSSAGPAMGALSVALTQVMSPTPSKAHLPARKPRLRCE